MDRIKLIIYVIDGADYVDYDSDFGEMNDASGGAGKANVDPYSGKTSPEIHL